MHGHMNEVEERRRSPDRRTGWSPAAERRRLAAALHDEALQSLLAARQDLQAAANGDLDAIAWATRALDDAVAQIRRIIAEHNDGPAFTGTLAEALATSAAEIARRSGMRTDIEVAGDVDGGGPHNDLLYRLAREFLINAGKHSGATRTSVRITREDGTVTLEVHDNGSGVDPEAPPTPGHVGLRVARERVSFARGTMHLGNHPAGGALVRVTLPE